MPWLCWRQTRFWRFRSPSHQSISSRRRHVNRRPILAGLGKPGRAAICWKVRTGTPRHIAADSMPRARSPSIRAASAARVWSISAITLSQVKSRTISSEACRSNSIQRHASTSPTTVVALAFGECH